MSSTGFWRVLPSADLPPPEGAAAGQAAVERAEPDLQPTIREVEVAGRKVLLTRLASGRVVAFASFCPHLGTPLHRATLCGEHLRCPQHHYVYDPHTGRNIVPARDAAPEELQRLRPGFLRTYPAVEQDGWVWVSEEPNPPPSA